MATFLGRPNNKISDWIKDHQPDYNIYKVNGEIVKDTPTGYSFYVCPPEYRAGLEEVIRLSPTVNEIIEEGFSNCPKLSAVSLPGIETINLFAFRNTPALTAMTLNCEYIRAFAFAGSSVKRLIAPKAGLHDDAYYGSMINYLDISESTEITSTDDIENLAPDSGLEDCIIKWQGGEYHFINHS